MYVVIVGGGNVGYYLSKALVAAEHEVLLMEKNRTTYRTVAEELGEIAMQGDGCEVRLLEEAGVGRADVVVAATGDDEDNLIICQMARMKFNVPRTIARVNNPQNERLFNQLGIDATVSSTRIIYNLIEQEIETGEVIPLAALRRGSIEIVQVEIGPKSPVLHRLVQEVVLPPEALVICIIRRDHAMLPAIDTRFEIGDEIIALVAADLEHQMRDVFAETDAD
ncbi:MAG TPA: NAD-binding protein [Chthonomonadales bacterium]|nr:NAD-binding protein [Chthonomonadales bacterium]